MTDHFLLLYSMTVFVASIIPGPSMLLALTHGMQYGARRTIASAMGNVAVTLIQAAVSIAGLGAILVASETVFQLVKWAGAAYLVYMGVGIMRSSAMGLVAAGNEAVDRGDATLGKMFLQAALVTAGNPKAIIFFTAVFPQFIDPHSSFLGQFCILMGAGALIAFSCFMLYAVGGQQIVALFSRSTVGKYLNKIIGGSFIASGVGLAVSNR
jgi:homoserine/homoserine lactone efflux protein